MKYRLLILLAALVVFSVLTSLAAQTRPASSTAPKAQAVAPAVRTNTAKAWAPAKTPWGDPDLQGTYTSDDCIGTPMQRAANLGEKRYYTEEELAQREATIARQAENDKQQYVAANAVVTV